MFIKKTKKNIALYQACVLRYFDVNEHTFKKPGYTLCAHHSGGLRPRELSYEHPMHTHRMICGFLPEVSPNLHRFGRIF
jgi:hypothetical protein